MHPLDDPAFIRRHRRDEDDLLDSDEENESNSRPLSVVSAKDYPRDEKKSYADDAHLTVPSAKGPGGSSRSRSPSATSAKLQKESPRDVKVGTGSSRSSNSHTGSTSGAGKRRGFFGKIGDKVFGTREERDAARAARRARKAEEERLYYEHRNAMLALREQQMQREREAYEQAGRAYNSSGQHAYVAPQMSSYGGPTYQNPSYYGDSPYPQSGNRNQSGLGGGGALLGGLVGGLLLGEILACSMLERRAN